MRTEPANNVSPTEAGWTPAERREALARLYRHLEALLDDMPYRRVEVATYLPLVVERLPDSEVSMAHYGVRNDDPMRDPELVFEVREEGGIMLAEPFYFRNDYLGVELYTRLRLRRPPADGLVYRPDQHEGLCRFAGQWCANLRQQGFFDV